MLRATAVKAGSSVLPFDIVVLTSEERHVRRKLLTLQHGDGVLVDLPEAILLSHGDRLVLEDGREAEVIAAEEDLLDIRGRDALHRLELCWHLGNRHLPAQIEAERILVARDHVIEAMLAGLGADVRYVREPFQPVRGAYHSHGGHAHGGVRGEGHDGLHGSRGHHAPHTHSHPHTHEH